MGLRPTNSDENHVGRVPSLRRPLRPPERGFNSYGGFSTVRGSSRTRAARNESAYKSAKRPAWTPAAGLKSCLPDSNSESDAAGKLKRARAARPKDVRCALRGLAKARLVQHFVIEGEVRNVEYIETLSQNRERQSFM